MAAPQALPAAIDRQLQEMLQNFSFAFVVSDCSKPDMPIVYASNEFYVMTGYSANEVRLDHGLTDTLTAMSADDVQHQPQRTDCLQVIGRNCRFLQGPETERRKVSLHLMHLDSGCCILTCVHALCSGCASPTGSCVHTCHAVGSLVNCPGNALSCAL